MSQRTPSAPHRPPRRLPARRSASPSRVPPIAPLALGLASCGLLDSAWIYERSAPDLTGVTKLEVETFNGPIAIAGGSGSSLTIGKRGGVGVSLERAGSTLNGEITMTDLASPLSLEATNGAITARDAASVTARSSNGNVRVQDIPGGVSVHTTNGGVQASNTGGSLEITTTNGPVTLENTVLPAGSQNLISTTNNDIKLRGLETQGGFVVQGRTNTASASFGLSGFDAQVVKSGFTATRAGQNPTTLKLESNNGSIWVNP